MKHCFNIGSIQQFTRVVQPEDCATFESGQVHPVYATFALARDAEWCCRLFALEMKDADEEGIGTMITVAHLAPATVGASVHFTATITALQKNEIICHYEAKVGDRVIARGQQGQKILKKERLQKLFDHPAE